MIDMPLVSVLMTSYNREKFIGESIESVLCSSYTNFELIIVDDCSTDKTFLIAKEYEAKDVRIKVFTNESNLKDYPNRNKAASLASGKYIKYVDSDDIIYPWGLYAMVDCMEKFPDAGYGLISYGINSDRRFPFFFTPAQAYYEFYFRGSMIITGPTGAIFRRDIFLKEDGFSGQPYLGDTEMWLKLSRNYGLVAMPLALVWWRQHEGQQIVEGMTNHYYEKKRYHVYLDALNHEDCPFNNNYKKNAIQNLKNRYARTLFNYIKARKINFALTLYKTYEFKYTDIFKSLKFNKYPPPL